MKKLVLIGTIAACTALTFAACTSNSFSANVAGAADHSTVVVKDFTSLGIVTVRATEVHHSGPLGFRRQVEGSKITFSDLMQEAARLEADDIINVRIDMHTSYTKGAFDWITGWTRTYTYTGTALAIKYTDMLEATVADPQLSGLPRTPQGTGAVRTSRSGQITLR